MIQTVNITMKIYLLVCITDVYNSYKLHNPPESSLAFYLILRLK